MKIALQKQPSPRAMMAALYPMRPAGSYTTPWDTILEACSRDVIIRLLDALREHEAYQVVYVIASMQTVAHRERWEAYAPYIKAAMMALDIVRHPLGGIHDWSVIEDAKRLLAVPNNDDLAHSLAEDLFAFGKEDLPFESYRRLSEFVPALLKHYGAETLAILLAVLSAATDIERYRLLRSFHYLPGGSAERRSAFDDLPIDDLLAACRRFPGFLPPYVAQTSALFSADDQGQLQPTTQVLMLLEKFGGDEQVRAAIESNLMSFASVGPRGPYYLARTALIERLPDFGIASIRSWLGEMRDRFVSIGDEQSKRDMEFQGGAW